jgi:hypothetical protein
MRIHDSLRRAIPSRRGDERPVIDKVSIVWAPERGRRVEAEPCSSKIGRILEDLMGKTHSPRT